jgi:hypothetical protein
LSGLVSKRFLVALGDVLGYMVLCGPCVLLVTHSPRIRAARLPDPCPLVLRGRCLAIRTGELASLEKPLFDWLLGLAVVAVEEFQEWPPEKRRDRACGVPSWPREVASTFAPDAPSRANLNTIQSAMPLGTAATLQHSASAQVDAGLGLDA